MRDWLSSLWYGTCYWSAKIALTLGSSLRIEGARHVPRHGPMLLVANHESFLDPPLVSVACPRMVWFLGRKTLFHNRFFGALVRSLNTVPVDQDGVAKEGLKTVLDLLHSGKPVVVFPEGERTLTGEMGPLKPGVHLLIKRGAAPIVPVGIAGAFQAFPRTRAFPVLSPFFMPATDSSIAVSIGKPIPCEHFQEMPRAQALAEVDAAIREMRARAHHLRRKT